MVSCVDSGNPSVLMLSETKTSSEFREYYSEGGEGNIYEIRS
jgi:hypothetical protein